MIVDPRRRRRLATAVSILLVGVAVVVWRLAFDNHPHSVAGLPPTLTLRLVGWGTPIQGYDPGGACPDGKFGMRIVSSLGRTVGAFVECDLAVGKTDRPDWGVRSTHATLATTYTVPGGTITADEQHAFLFSRQHLDSKKPVTVRGRFRGRITGGTGRYAHARGTLTGEGIGVNDDGSWTVTFHFT